MPETDPLGRKALEGLAFFLLALAVLIFLPALTLNFWEGWLYWFLFGVSVTAITLYFLKRDPALIARRLKAGSAAETEPRQRLIQALAQIAFIALLVIPGLDRHFGWSAVPRALVFACDGLALNGFAIVFLVFRENSFTSGIIEVAEGQKVIDTGPYGLVRHPMYAGAFLLLLGTPLALGSWWGLLAAIALIGVIFWRLLDEEEYLAKNLPGYEAYRQKVRWRLVPGAW